MDSTDLKKYVNGEFLQIVAARRFLMNKT